MQNQSKVIKSESENPNPVVRKVDSNSVKRIVWDDQDELWQITSSGQMNVTFNNDFFPL